MVVGAFPVVKLGSLVFKQISKPLSNFVKRRAKNSLFFRNYICMPPAQFYHWAEVKMKMWSMGSGKPVNVPKLSDAMAIDLGAELLGEGIIFFIAFGLLIEEYVRSSRKEEKKEEDRTDEVDQVKNDIQDLNLESTKQNTQLKELVRILHVKIPDVSYTPEPYDTNLIPEHHRKSHKEEELSIYSYVKGWVWWAMELIIDDEIDD